MDIDFKILSRIKYFTTLTRNNINNLINIYVLNASTTYITWHGCLLLILEFCQLANIYYDLIISKLLGKGQAELSSEFAQYFSLLIKHATKCFFIEKYSNVSMDHSIPVG